jgi:tryptophan-rich sensory protein
MTPPDRRRQAIGFLGWLAACLVTGGIGAYASANAASFYGRLAQPSWAPPAWLFGPVWTTLYVMMAVAAWLVWRRHGFDSASGAKVALRLFVLQLVANALWTWLFFVWHQGALALAEIVVLSLMIAATIAAFWRLNRLAALLLLPYLAWVSFATALTYALWRANPTLLG